MVDDGEENGVCFSASLGMKEVIFLSKEKNQPVIHVDIWALLKPLLCTDLSQDGSGASDVLGLSVDTVRAVPSRVRAVSFLTQPLASRSLSTLRLLLCSILFYNRRK